MFEADRKLQVSLLFGALGDQEDVTLHLSPQELVQQSRTPYSHFVKVQGLFVPLGSCESLTPPHLLENVLMSRLGKLYYKYLIANHLKPPQGSCFPTVTSSLLRAPPLPALRREGHSAS
jgi:hypothetical protein